MGIEPMSSAWKAEVLPLNYSRLAYCHNNRTWWREVDSNHRRHSQLIYSQPPLAAWVSLRDGAHYCVFGGMPLSTSQSRKICLVEVRSGSGTTDQHVCVRICMEAFASIKGHRPDMSGPTEAGNSESANRKTYPSTTIRSSRGSANTMFSRTPSSSSTSPCPNMRRRSTTP